MGWQKHRLDELFDIARGGSPRPIKQYLTTEEDGVNWIKISDATSSSKYIYETKERIKPEGVRRSRLVHEGDFILSNSMSFGRPYIMKTSGCIHDGWVVLSPRSERVDQDFLFHLLGSPVVYKQFDQLAAGSTVRNLNIGLVSSVRVPVPPLAEQKQIVTILDAASADIDRARQLADRNLNNARELFDSSLNQVFASRSDCEWMRVSELSKTSAGGTPLKSKKEYYENGTIPWLMSGEVANKNITKSKRFITELGLEKSSAKIFPKNSVLIAMYGATAGEVGLLRFESCSNQAICAIHPSERIHSEFLYYFFKYFQKQLSGQAVGNAQPNISQKKIRSTYVPVPSLEEQVRIMNKINALSTKTEKLLDIYQQKIIALDELKQSLLQKAFCGELTQGQAAT